MNKRIFLTMLLLTSLIGSSVLNVSAAKTKAIWCKDIKTLYFLYDDKEYVAGGKYGENTITQVCNVYGSWPYHNKVEDILNNCTTVVIEDNFKDSGLNTCYGMFHSFKALTSVQGLKNMITTSTKDLGTMFFNCSSLTTIDFSGVNTSNVTNMSDMFQGCSALSTLDLSNFDTKKVQYMQDMFKDCQSLATLTLGEFNTSKVENMSYMFYGCQTLTTLDLRCFDTSLVTNMYNMFFNCNHLTSLDVTSFNTSRVTNMSYMFGFCKALASLNLYSFDVSEVTNMTYMFYDAAELVTIVAEENWEEVGSKISSSSDMFTNCNKLKGNINYSSSNTTVHYANLNGYFTKRPEVDMSFSPSTAVLLLV